MSRDVTNKNAFRDAFHHELVIQLNEIWPWTSLHPYVVFTLPYGGFAFIYSIQRIIDHMLHIQYILFVVLPMLSVKLTSAAPQVRQINQDVGEPDEYVDNPAGRHGDQWWRNYEAVEDHVNDFDDHLEMFYMYSVNPLEVTTVRSGGYRGTPASLHSAASPFAQPPRRTAAVEVPLAPAVTPTPVRRRTTTTTTQPPSLTEAPAVRPFSRTPVARRPSTLQSPQPNRPPLVRSELQPPEDQSSLFTFELPQSPVPSFSPVAETFAPRRPSTLTTTAATTTTTTQTPVPVIPDDVSLPLSQGRDWDQAARRPEELPVQRGRVRVRVRRPHASRPASQSTEATSVAVIQPGIKLDSGFQPAAIPTALPRFIPDGPSDGNDIGAFSPSQPLQTLPEVPSAAIQNADAIPRSRVTVNPFLAPAHIPPPLPRYSRLLNRYSILDEVSDGGAGQPDFAEAGRSIRQPSPLIDETFPPSARNFDSDAVGGDPTTATSRRARKRRLRTTTIQPLVAFDSTATVPLAVFDSELSDSEEVLVSQQPGQKLRTTRGRFVPSTAITTPFAPAYPDIASVPQEEFLPPTTATVRPLFTGKRRRTTTPPPGVPSDFASTGDAAAVTIPHPSEDPIVDIRTTLLPRQTFVRPDRTTKIRTSFIETSTTPLDESIFSGATTDFPKSDDSELEVNTESFRIRGGKFQASRRAPTTTPATTLILSDTSETPLEPSTPIAEAALQQPKRIGKFRPKPSTPRLFGSGAVEQLSVTDITGGLPTTKTHSTTPRTTDAASPASSEASITPQQNGSTSKFKSRPTFRRTTTTPATVPTTDTIPTSTEDSIAIEADTSRVQLKGFKPRGFTSDPTATTESPVIVSSTEAIVFTESRKFKPRSGFPRFQDSAKRSLTTATTSAPQTSIAPTKPSRFKPKTTLSRFQVGGVKTLPTTATTAQTAESLLTTLPPTSGDPEPTKRPLFNKGRTTRIFLSRSPFSSSLPSSTQLASSTVAFEDLQSTFPPAMELTTTLSSRKQRRRPTAKKSPLSSGEQDILSGFSTDDDFSRVPVTDKKEGRRGFSTVITTTALPLSETFPAELQSTTLLTEPPQRRKFRRRKLTQRSTHSLNDEVRGDIVAITLSNLTTVKAVGNSINSSEDATTHAPNATSDRTAFQDTFTSVDKLKLLPISKSSSKNAAQQLIFDLEEPLEMEADDTGDDSGIWFSDSVSIRNEGIEAFSRSGGGGGNKPGSWFQIEPENSSIKNPSLKRLSDSDDRKSWFGLADEGVPKAAESSPGKTTVLQKQSESSSVSVSQAEGTTETEKQGANLESLADHKPKVIQQSKSSSFSVSSSTSVHTETSKSRTSQSSEQPKLETFQIEEGSPKIIIIDKVTLDDDNDARDRSQNSELSDVKVTEETPDPSIAPNARENQKTATEEIEGARSSADRSLDDQPEERDGERPTSDRNRQDQPEDRDGARSPLNRNRDVQPEERPTSTARSSRERLSGKSSRDQDSRTDKSSSRSSSRGRVSSSRTTGLRSSGRSSGRDRSSSSRRDRGSTTTTTTTTTTTEPSDPETTTANVDINKTTKKKSPSDEVGYFGEEEVAPVAHGALDGPTIGGSESGVFDSFDSDFPSDYSERSSEAGEVASVDVSEHNDPNDKGHNSESATGDESSLWELSPLSEFSGPIRESSSFKVEVRRKAPKLIQLAARREAKSARSGLNDDFSKAGSRNKVRTFLKMIGFNGATEVEDTNDRVSVTEVSPFGGSGRTIASKAGVPFKGFAYPVPPLKSVEDIAELFEIITAPPVDVPKPYRPISKVVILKQNSSSGENVTSKQLQNVSRDSTSSKLHVLDGPTNCSRSDRNICPTSEAYPRQLVDLVVKQHEEKIKWLWQELQAYRTPTQLYPNDVKRQQDDLSVCDSSIEALQPGWARDAVTGKWMIIVNTPQYPQILRVESCLRLKKECLFISPYYKSSCVEHFSAHRMVAIRPDDPASGPVVSIFKFPCGCSCKVGMVHGGN